jgi:ribosome biogenesis GTPase A
MVFPCGHSFCSFCFPEKEIATCFICREEGKIVLNYALYEEILKDKNAHIEKYIKVCLFGNTHVGKSSLIKRIVDDEF